MNFWSNKNVTITGGAGFIGSHLAKDLLNEGASIKIIDNLERGKLYNIQPLLNDLEFIEGDIRDINICYSICDKSDVVFHLASKVGGIGYYLSKPGEVITNNITMDNNMIKAVLDANVEKYFFSSSAHVYPIDLQKSSKSKPIKEEQAYPANPELSYGWSKLLSEKQLEYYYNESVSTKIAIARLVGIYGENQDIDLSTGSVIPVFCRRAIEYPKNKPFIIWGTGQETRSYCFIDDAIYCMKKMVEKLEYTNLVGPLNVGRQVKTSIIDLAKKIISISGKQINLEFDQTKKTLIWGQWCDCSKAIKELDGWQSKIPLEVGLNKVYSEISKRLIK